MGPGVTGYWESLSLELWVNILSRVEANFDVKFAWGQCLDREDFAQMHTNLQQLRLVCTKFNTALDDAQLSRCLLLRRGFQSKHLPSLVQWVHCHCMSLQVFATSDGTPTLEPALAAIVSPGSQLLVASVADASAAAIHLLSCHSTA